MNTIRGCAADDAHVIYGTAQDEGLEQVVQLGRAPQHPGMPGSAHVTASPA